MVKNLMVLALLTWVSFSHAKPDYSVAKDSMADAESYKVEKPVAEQEATRGVAGSKIKKKKAAEMKGDGPSQEAPSETDSEVRYWQYSE